MNLPKLIRDLYNLDTEMEKVEDYLNKLRAKRHLMATVDIPEAMTEIGSNYIVLNEDNLRCEVAYKIYGSLPSRDDPDKRHAAIEYLKENEASDLITSKVQVAFAKGDIRHANKLARALNISVRKGEIEAEDHEPVVSVDNDVNHMSLQAWGRRRVAENIPTDLALVGLRGMTQASVKKLKS